MWEKQTVVSLGNENRDLTIFSSHLNEVITLFHYSEYREISIIAEYKIKFEMKFEDPEDENFPGPVNLRAS